MLCKGSGICEHNRVPEAVKPATEHRSVNRTDCVQNAGNVEKHRYLNTTEDAVCVSNVEGHHYVSKINIVNFERTSKEYRSVNMT